MQTPPDEFEFCTDGPNAGTILVVSRGYAYRCRRPLLREYRSFRARVTDLFGEDDISEWVADVVAELSGEAVDPVPSWFCDSELPNRIVNHWRHVPLGPWEKARSTAGTAATGPLSGVFAEMAPILEGLAAHHIDPRVADEMEIWEIASVLGLHDPDRSSRTAPDETRHPRDPRGRNPGPAAPRHGGGHSRPAHVPDQSEINAARVRAAAEGAAPPAWGPEHATGDEAGLMRELQG